MIRSFIAFELTKEAVESLAATQTGMKRGAEGVRWVNPAGIHLTINFLGSIPEEHIPLIHRAMMESVAGSSAIELVLTEVDAFPNKFKPRVIWVGLGGDIDRMARIKEKLDNLLQPLGFVPENRPFRLHLTLGRVKNVKNVRRLKEAIGRAEVADPTPFMVTKLVLFKSELFPDGARYTPLAEVGLT